ncbi:MAG: PQQ-dependent sugar dehydrogenase [Acidimicrobiia bacterium]
MSPVPWRCVISFLTVMLVVLTACSSGGSPEASSKPSTTPESGTQPGSSAGSSCDTPNVTVSGSPGQSTFATDAKFVTALAWAPDGRLFFAERAGTIKIASGSTVKEFTTVRTVTGEKSGSYSERGLLGLALSPDFSNDHFVYAFSSRDDYSTQVVARFTECAGEARDETTLVTLPSGADCCHKGGRLAFGKDGKLYVTLGDEHSVAKNTVGSTSSIPQDPNDVRGKILRYEPDGSIPSDNPFGADSPVWATGFRNPFGIAFDTDGGTFATSNGPTGDVGAPRTGYDLAFRVEAGGRYQWPACYGYSHLLPGASSCLGRPEPEWSSEESTIVPTGATWVDHKGPAPYAGHFVFCSASGMRVFIPGSPHATLRDGPKECQLDVKEGPDHALYFSDETKIYRLGGA